MCTGVDRVGVETGCAGAVKERRRDLAVMNREKVVNAESNYCFGEGGAGTYSDGKLYTRSNKRGPVQKVLQSLVDHGAPEAIKYEAHPHIGTNKLPQLVEGLRKSIEDCGGEVRFNSRVDGMELTGGKVKALMLNGGVRLEVDAVVLAAGSLYAWIFEVRGGWEKCQEGWCVLALITYLSCNCGTTPANS